jgi:pyruvate kinase
MKIDIIPTLGIYGEEYYINQAKKIKQLNIKLIRINLTRYDIKRYLIELKKIKQIFKENGCLNIEFMIDIPFPGDKTRIEFDGENSKIELIESEIIYLNSIRDKMNYIKRNFYASNYQKFKTGEIVNIDDGKIKGIVINSDDKKTKIKITKSGTMSYKKSISGDLLFALCLPLK